MIQDILAESTCLRIKDLAVKGNDLMALGYAPGPELGQCLERLLNLVLDEAVANEKSALLEKAKEFLTITS